MKRAFVSVVILTFAALACGGTAPRQLNLYPSPTVESTTSWLILEITSTPNPTQEPSYIVISATPNATALCVSALVAEYLRPSPSNQNYPITDIPNGTELLDLGGRSGDWVFIELGDKQGWVHGDYVEECR